VELSEDGLPARAACVVVGGGVLGLATAGALARRGEEVVLLEKLRVGAGASGIAGGIVRGYYRSPAMAEVVRRSIEVFERAPERFGFRQVGYFAVVPERQVADLEAIAVRQAEVGLDSELVLGHERCADVLTWMWPDFDAGGVEALLHERRSGWADTAATIRALADNARDAGARIVEGVRATGLAWSGAEVRAVVTERGAVECDLAVVVPGPWAQEWLAGFDADRGVVELWRAQEGDFVLPGVGLAPRAGREAPVVHYDHSGPLRADDGRVVVNGPWGIYFRLGRTGTGIVGGGLPERLGGATPLEPYGEANPEHVAGESFVELFTAGLGHVLKRFRGAGSRWEARPGGGVIALTADGYPVLDRVAPNAYLILDGGAAFKLLALGELAAADLLDGGEPLLEPFRLGRFRAGRQHVASASPYPWT
jgi:glycine/D-amino acid oxidase-like deaminating enzyme